jgi:hypothetical protein
MARPSKYSPVIAATICSAIADGVSVRKICALPEFARLAQIGRGHISHHLISSWIAHGPHSSRGRPCSQRLVTPLRAAAALPRGASNSMGAAGSARRTAAASPSASVSLAPAIRFPLLSADQSRDRDRHKTSTKLSTRNIAGTTA